MTHLMEVNKLFPPKKWKVTNKMFTLVARIIIPPVLQGQGRESDVMTGSFVVLISFEIKVSRENDSATFWFQIYCCLCDLVITNYWIS